MASWNPVRRSAMHHKQLTWGAAMVERDGWQQPAAYSTVEEELQRLNEGAGLFDISPCGKLSLRGDDLESLLASTFSDVGGLAVGEVRLVASTNLSEPESFVIARLALDEFLALTPAGQAPRLAEDLEEVADRCAHVLDITSGMAGVRITGPQSNLLLRKISELDVSLTTFADMRCAQTKAAEIHGTLLRMDRGSLPCYELYFPREFGEYMWDALMEAGVEYKLAPVGFEAMANL